MMEVWMNDMFRSVNIKGSLEESRQAKTVDTA